MNLTLTRDELTGAYTYGVLVVGGVRFQTMERPWIPAPDHPGGTIHVSCVPIGTYTLEIHDSEKHPQTWALVNPELGVWHWAVPAGKAGRCLVLIHPANVAAELEGCIAPGLTRGMVNGTPAVLQSRPAFSTIKSLVPWVNGHTITIGVTP